MPIQPEAADNRGEQQSAPKNWWEKWLELFGNLLGVKDLEKTVASLASEKDAGKIKEALGKLQSADKSQEKEDFVRRLTGFLLSEENKQEEIDKLLSEKLETETDSETKDVVERFDKVRENQSQDENEYVEAMREVKEKKDRSVEAENKKLEEVGINEDEEIKRIRSQIEEHLGAQVTLTQEEKNRLIGGFWDKAEEDLIVEATTGKRSVLEIKKIAVRRQELAEAKKLFGEVMANSGTVDLSDEQRRLLDSFLSKYIVTDSEKVDLILDELEGRVNRADFFKLLVAVSRGGEEEQAREATRSESGAATPNDAVSRLVDLFTGRRRKDKKTPDQFDENDWEQLRVSGMLNINPERYSELNGAIEEDLNIKNALVVDEQRKTARVNKRLSKEEKEKVNKYFRKKLISEVRMMVDESVQINNSNIDARATEYVTLMSVMGLSTSMKSDVMNSARRMTFAFMLFNTPQTEEGYRQLSEYAAQIGPEYSVLEKVMKLREDITIEIEGGKELELTDLSQIDFVNVASQAIIDPNDRLHYGIKESPDKVGRTYADMMMASNQPDVRSKDRVPVMRKVLRERLGEDGYEAMLKRIGVKGEDGTYDRELETKYLQSAGDKYWDYFNGIYAYYLMTRSSGEFVGNCNPDNSRLRVPAGLNENFNFKMDPSAWVIFQEVYNVPNFPEVVQLFRFNGNSSLASKEGGEVLSYLINTKRDPVTKLPSIAEAFYGSGGSPSEDKLIRLREIFVGSIFLPDQYHLGGTSARLARKSHIYDALPQKFDKDGKLKLDATAQRRDFLSARKLMERGLSNLYREDPTFFNDMNFDFLKTEFASDEVLIQILNSDITPYEKMLAFAGRYGEDKLLFRNLSNKRPDDFTKYAIDYHKEWQQAAAALAAKPTWATLIKMLAVVERIVGKGEKMDPIAMRSFEYMVELRKQRVWGEGYIRQIQKDGALEYKDGGYIGELPGHFPVPDLEEKHVTLGDIQENGGKATSIVAMRGAVGEVDEEGTEPKVLSAMAMASLITEDTYKKAYKQVIKGYGPWSWHKERPFLTEVWDTVSGKKIRDYLAVGVFHMPPDYFMQWVIGGTGDFFKLWAKYLNS